MLKHSVKMCVSALCCILFVQFGTVTVGASQDISPDKVKRLLDSALADVDVNNSEHTGYALHVIADGIDLGVAKGAAEPGGTPLDASHMFRLASITKSYVGTAVLRLVEEGRLNLSTPINQLIKPEYDALLRADGYDTNTITLKHAITHTAGFFDHAQTQNFLDQLKRDPQHVWTRDEQLKAAVEWGEPVGAPGEKFFYSDTGFVLIGHIIERVTGEPLPVAVRILVGFDRHDLRQTVWERGDHGDVPDGKRVHQYMMGQDTHTWDPSVDLYGGGGLVASPRDVARFYSLLFGGQIYNQPETLDLMLSADDLPDGSPYRHAVFVKDYKGLTVYEHGGFWGTLVLYDPETKVAIAGATLKQSDFRTLVGKMIRFLKALKQ